MHVLIFFWCPHFVAHRCAVIVSVFFRVLFPRLLYVSCLLHSFQPVILVPSDNIVDCFGDSVSLSTGLLLISGIWRRRNAVVPSGRCSWSRFMQVTERPMCM